MALQKVISLIERLEDPKYPLLGPTLKGLYLFGLWQTGSRLRTITYNITLILVFLFLITQYIDLYTVRHDLNKALNNSSVTIVSTICYLKIWSYVKNQKLWRKLVSEISEEEILQIRKSDPMITKLINEYTKYTRIVTYLYWVLVFGTNLLLIATPLFKYASSKSYREDIKSGKEPLPQIVCSWFPFDNTKLPGYIFGVCVHIMMSSQGSGVIAVYDMNSVAIMTYLKGQMRILKETSRSIFDGNDLSADIVVDRIRECHRHHSVLVKHYHMFNALLSPTMFIYVLLCSITLCCSVMQFTSNKATTSQKMWVIEYTSALVSQLFLFCWHSNEVAVESKEVDIGVYESSWWKGNKYIRRKILLLAAKLDQPLVLNAGPYTTLSVPTFIHIMKGSYSFYTLFSRMQDDK